MTQKGSQNLLTCVTYLTCSTNSTCHFRGNDNCVQVANKVAAFKIKLELWGHQVNTEIFDMFQTSAEIERDRARAFFLQAGALITYLQTGKEWIHDLFVNKPGESNLSML